MSLGIRFLNPILKSESDFEAYHLHREPNGDSGMIVALALFLLVVFQEAATEEECYRIARENGYPEIKPS